MAFLPPKSVLDVMDKVSRGEKLTIDESEILSTCAKSYKSSNVGDSGIFSFLGGFASSYFIGNSSNDKH